MDIISIEWGLALLLLFVGPVIYIIRAQSQKEKKAIKAITKSSSEEVNITQSELTGNRMIAIDSTNKKLFFVSLPVKKETLTTIDLKKIVDVEVVSKTENKTTAHVALQLKFTDAAKQELAFFDDEVGTDANISLHQAKQWKNVITDLL